MAQSNKKLQLLASTKQNTDPVHSKLTSQRAECFHAPAALAPQVLRGAALARGDPVG